MMFRALILGLALSGAANAAMVTFDEGTFFASFDNPTATIDFTTLKDGTTLSSLSTSSPYFAGSIVGGQPAIRENAWSDDFLIRSTNGFNYTAAMLWNGNSVGIVDQSFTPRLSIYSLGDASPFTLEVTSDIYSGFVGVIPHHPNDKEFNLFLPNLRLTGMQTGFTEVSPVPLPAAAWLFASALGVFGYVGSRAKTANHRKRR